MKLKSAVFLVVLVIAANTFGQVQTTSPREIVNAFWDLASKNDFENTKRFFHKTTFGNENYQRIKEDVEFIARNEVKIIASINEQIDEEMAFFHFKLKSKQGDEFEGQIMFLRLKNEWKILVLYLRKPFYKPAELNLPTPPKAPVFNPFYIPRGYPVKKDCPKCA